MSNEFFILHRPDPNSPIVEEEEPAVEELDNTILGNDGLTDAERAEYAAQYRRNAGSKVITPAERAAAQLFFKNKRANG